MDHSGSSESSDNSPQSLLDIHHSSKDLHQQSNDSHHFSELDSHSSDNHSTKAQGDHQAYQWDFDKSNCVGREEKQRFMRSPFGKILNFHHVTFWVGNAKQVASFYSTRMGFEYIGYKGLETGDRKVASHVLRNNNVTFQFCSAYNQDSNEEMNAHLVKHGDGVKDVAFTVEDARAIYEYATQNGAIGISQPHIISDEDGSVWIAQVKTYGDTTHTFVQCRNYKGKFLPGYKPHHYKEALNNILPAIKLDRIDHIVVNLPELAMESVVEFYEQVLAFHRLWPVENQTINTQYSFLHPIVVADFDDKVKIFLNEPAKGWVRSPIQEYLDHYHGAGVQHIALKCEDIISVVESLRARGVEFLSIPNTYYDHLRRILADSPVRVWEDIDMLQRNKILLDHDDNGYLLQIFTKPLEDRPTLFFGLIQRRYHESFGADNFKRLFMSIEEEQAKRGNL